MYPNEETTTNENLTQDFNSDTNINTDVDTNIDIDTNTQSINNMTIDWRSYDELEVYPTSSKITEPEQETWENLNTEVEYIPTEQPMTKEQALEAEKQCAQDLTNYIDQDFKRSSWGNISTDVTKSLDKQIQFNIQELARAFLTEKLSIPKTTPMQEVEKILQESNLLVDLDVSKDSHGVYFVTCNILTKKHSQKFKLSIKNEVSYENV